MSDGTVQLDWRGLKGPEPILKTARSLRELRGSDAHEVRVLSDDADFPADMSRWCKSAGINLIGVEEDSRGFVATISLEPLAASSKEAASAPRSSEPEGMIETLDCVGLKCPEPILKTARRVREMGLGTLDVVCDDPDFVHELRTWIKKSSAEIVSIQELGRGEVRVRLLARPRPKRARSKEESSPPLSRTDRFPGTHTGTTARLPRASAHKVSRARAGTRACLLIVRDDEASAMAALATASAAIARGHATSLFFAFDGVRMLGEGGVISVERLASLARAGAKIMVCEETFAAARVERDSFGLQLPFVLSSMAAFVEAADGASVSLVF